MDATPYLFDMKDQNAERLLNEKKIYPMLGAGLGASFGFGAGVAAAPIISMLYSNAPAYTPYVAPLAGAALGGLTGAGLGTIAKYSELLLARANYLKSLK